MIKINLTDEQLEEVKKVWSVYDKDNNGYLDKDELKSFIKDLNVFMEMIGMALTENEIEELIAITDQNGDGNVDYEEFARVFILDPR
jgi:calmodulin